MVETGKLALREAALNEAEAQALQAFASQLLSSYPRQIHQISLFGSKARGDNVSDSDVDVLIIVNQEDRALRRGIIDLASDLSLEYDVLLSPRVINVQRWQSRQGFRLYRNIARDAIAISTSQDR